MDGRRRSPVALTAAHAGVLCYKTSTMCHGHHTRRAALAAALAALASTATGVAQTDPRPAAVVPAIDGVLAAFRTAPVVALGEGGHGNTRTHAFRLALVRDPRFAETVNDIVVESGSARYQAVMDRFIDGGDVPRDLLRRAWEDTTATVPVFELPIYEEFFRAVRAVNASLPAERRLRVLLGDPPIDWTTIRTLNDFLPWNYQRDAHAAGLIRREVLAKGRRALVVYGDGHVWRRDLGKGIVTLLEESGVPVFAISAAGTGGVTPPPESTAWPVPGLVPLRGTALGRRAFTDVYAAGMSGPHKPYEGVRFEDQFDATLYLGPRTGSTDAVFPQELCADAEYVKERLRRINLARSTPVEKLRECP